MAILNNSWDYFLKDEWNKKYYLKLKKHLINEYKTKTIFPKMEDIFNSLKYVDYFDVKVVILGQDPYYNKGLADGLCFSVLEKAAITPSLVNILKETETDLKISQPKNKGNLKKWAKQGVLLLNSTLTVEEFKPNSHAKLGWQILTDKIISILNKRKKPIVFLLWGNFAIKKQSLISSTNHKILKSPHPSPLSAFRGFFGCKHFSKANEFLKNSNQTPIDWQL